MDWQKDFDDLLNTILTDYKNQFPAADVSQGSLIFIRSAMLASALWGLYKYQDYIAEQIFPDSSDSQYLVQHVWTRGLAIKAGETDEAMLERLLEYIRRPPAGGNKYDYVKWAKEITDVKEAYCVPLAQGPGSVDTIIIADESTTGSETPTQELIDTVKTYIDDVRPVTAKYTRVLAATFADQDVTMVGSGTDWDPQQAALDIAAYLGEFIPNQILYLAQLTNIAVQNGAEDVVITMPVANIAPNSGEILRPGVVNVT